jgi:hypothetical protein
MDNFISINAETMRAFEKVLTTGTVLVLIIFPVFHGRFHVLIPWTDAPILLDLTLIKGGGLNTRQALLFLDFWAQLLKSNSMNSFSGAWIGEWCTINIMSQSSSYNIVPDVG